jgi:uncharacterized ParB-like nuclease family protein
LICPKGDHLHLLLSVASYFYLGETLNPTSPASFSASHAQWTKVAQHNRNMLLQIDILLVDGKYYGFSGCHRFEVDTPLIGLHMQAQIPGIFPATAARELW